MYDATCLVSVIHGKGISISLIWAFFHLICTIHIWIMSATWRAFRILCLATNSQMTSESTLVTCFVQGRATVGKMTGFIASVALLMLSWSYIFLIWFLLLFHLVFSPLGVNRSHCIHLIIFTRNLQWLHLKDDRLMNSCNILKDSKGSVLGFLQKLLSEFRISALFNQLIPDSLIHFVKLTRDSFLSKAAHKLIDSFALELCHLSETVSLERYVHFWRKIFVKDGYTIVEVVLSFVFWCKRVENFLQFHPTWVQ